MVNNMEHGNSQDEETEPRRPQEESHGGTLSKESASGLMGMFLMNSGCSARMCPMLRLLLSEEERKRREKLKRRRGR